MNGRGLQLQIDCAGGTYIRSIAHDAGELLGCGGYVETLVRTRVGPFTLADAACPEALSAEGAISEYFARLSMRCPICLVLC